MKKIIISHNNQTVLGSMEFKKIYRTQIKQSLINLKKELEHTIFYRHVNNK